jgi:hypothetical protein
MVEHARKEMGEKKRKFESSGQFSSNSRPDSRPRKEHPSAKEDRTWIELQLQAELVPTPLPTGSAVAASSACQSVSAASQLSA